METGDAELASGESAGIPKGGEGGMISVIVPVYAVDDSLVDMTERCFDSLRHISETYQLIIVDNGSPKMISRFPGAVGIFNNDNLGYAKAVNQGIARALGDELLILNNDCELTEGAVEEMRRYLHDLDTGAVTACPAGSHGPQGCCWMIKKTMFERIGPMDERYEIATFEDTDYWRRIEDAGLKVKIAERAAVKHVGRATFSRLLNHEEIFKKNKERFEAKWGCLA